MESKVYGKGGGNDYGENGETDQWRQKKATTITATPPTNSNDNSNINNNDKLNCSAFKSLENLALWRT